MSEPSDIEELLAPIVARVGASQERTCYAIDDIRAKATVVRDLPGGILAVLEHDDEAVIVSFIVLELYSGEASNGSPDLYTKVFTGWGVSGALRELRHTSWGDDDGYLAYPSAALIVGAFRELGEWFDPVVP